MTDPILHIPEGTYPLLPLSNRPLGERQWHRDALPEVQLVLGRDQRSSGLTVVVWEQSEGHYPNRRTLYAARWLEPILTTEGALRMASNGLVAAVDELFGPELPS